MTDIFQQPAQQPSTLQRIGQGLQGFGAGVQGRGQQFLAGQQQQRQTLSNERLRAAAEDVRRGKALVDAGDLQGFRDLLQERIGMIEELGGDASDTAGFLPLVEGAIGGDRTAFNALNAQLGAAEQAAADRGFIKLRPAPRPQSPAGKLQADITAGFVTPEQALASATSTAEAREFETLIKGLSPEEAERARRIKLGLDPREVGAAGKIFDIGGVPHIFDPVTREAVRVKVKGEEITAEQVAGSETEIAEAIERGKGRVVLSNKVIDKGFTAIGNINSNIRNIDRALGALGRGASTGAVQRFFPNIRAASVELGQIQKELGLDIVSAVTFGALSKGELDLALGTALPTGLSPPDLTDFLNRKKTAQEKLRDYYRDQISFLDGGGTVAEFTAQQRRDVQDGELPPGLPEGTVAIGNNQFRLPDGTVVEPE